MDAMNKISLEQILQLFNVSQETVRLWEKKGLIKTISFERGHKWFSYNEIVNIVNGSANRYRIIVSPKQSKFSVIELFSGAGGLALGLKHAGLNAKMLVEIDRDAAKTLKINNPDWNVIHDDIKNVSFKGISSDVVAGGFPCQAFSSAGKKQGFEDERGNLFFEFLRAIREIKPKIIVAENVKGLEKHNNGKTLKIILDCLIEAGYKVNYRILRSQFLDVPQKRERIVIIGTRIDLNIPIFFPKEKDYYVSLKEALHNVPLSDGIKYNDKKKAIMDLIPEGGYWKDLPEEIKKEYMGKSFYLGGGKTGVARRLSMKEPSLTLTCSPAQKQTERCHPIETRPLTIREYARIQCFPDNWIFTGSVLSQYRQIGNAVPVNLGYHIGQAIIAMLENKIVGEINTLERGHCLLACGE